MEEQNFDPQAVPQNSEQAEQLFNHMTQGSPEAEPEVSQEVEQTETQEVMHALKRNGVEETFPLSKILDFAQQGRDYQEKMRDLKVQRTLWEKERANFVEKNKYAELEKKLHRYSEVEAYIQKNPQWWKHVESAWATRDHGQNPQGTPDIVNHPFVQSLVQRLEGMEGKLSKTEEQEQLRVQTQEDEQLDKEISSYRDQFPDLDWKSVDDQGFDLEKRILNHAIQNDIKSFKVAARDFLFDEHLTRAQSKGKTQVGKELQKATKLGLGPITKTPQLKLKAAEGVGTKSYDELAREAMEQMGMVQGG